MDERDPKKVSNLSIDIHRLGMFLFHVIVGIGLVSIWFTLFAFVMSCVLWAGFLLLYMDLLTYIFLGLLIPIVIFAFWFSHYFAMQFLNEIGIKLKGKWQFLVVPISFPLAMLAFLLEGMASLGETLISRGWIGVAFTIGLILGIGTTILVVHTVL